MTASSASDPPRVHARHALAQAIASAHDRVSLLARDLDFTRNLALAQNRDLADGIARNLALALGRDLAQNRDLADGIARNLAHDLDLAQNRGESRTASGRDLALARNLTHNLTLALALGRDLAIDHNLTLALDLDRDLDRDGDLNRHLDRIGVLADDVAQVCGLADALGRDLIDSRQRAALDRGTSSLDREPGRVCRQLVKGATWMLPASYRSRWLEEYQAELWDLGGLPRRRQLAHAVRVVGRCWSLRRSLTTPAPKMSAGSGTDG